MKAMMGMEFVGVFGLILLVLIVWAGLHIVQSNASMGGKVIWIVVLLVFPFLGFLGWLLFGPRKI